MDREEEDYEEEKKHSKGKGQTATTTGKRGTGISQIGKPKRAKKSDTLESDQEDDDESGDGASGAAKGKVENGHEEESKQEAAGGGGEEKDPDRLEDFEIGASEWVTKTEATKVYCLSQGTLAVCHFLEQPNPRGSHLSRMKLFNRKEIRIRARDRWGGLEGLQQERKRRQQKQFEKDMEKARACFR